MFSLSMNNSCISDSFLLRINCPSSTFMASLRLSISSLIFFMDWLTTKYFVILYYNLIKSDLLRFRFKFRTSFFAGASRECQTKLFHMASWNLNVSHFCIDWRTFDLSLKICFLYQCPWYSLLELFRDSSQCGKRPDLWPRSILCQ